jgi:Holliday junction resolvase RusA-like endonuclease
VAKISIKPLSVNEVWQGRRFKTQKYKKYESDVLVLLPSLTIPEGRLCISLEFGFSNTQSDWDNPIKPFVDILQLKYQFNDNRIYRAEVIKTKVKKGEEFIRFEIKELCSD